MKEPDNRPRANIWLTSTTSALIGAATAWAADHYILSRNDIYTNPNDQGTVLRITPTPQEQIVIYPTVVPRLEGPLNPEVQKRIEQSLVKVQMSIKPDLEHYKFQGPYCNGFVIRDSSGKPLIATAKHCYPDYMISPADGRGYSTIYGEGQSIFKINVTDINNKSYEAFPHNNYISESGHEAPDVMLFQVDDKNFNPPGLTLNLNSLNTWETLHRVSLNTDRVTTHPFQFLEISPQYQTLRFFSVSEASSACEPGTSGSAIVNGNGEVVALMATNGFEQISEEIARKLNLGPSFVGSKITYCSGPNASQIKGLIRNP